MNCFRETRINLTYRQLKNFGPAESGDFAVHMQVTYPSVYRTDNIAFLFETVDRDVSVLVSKGLARKIKNNIFRNLDLLTYEAIL